LCSLQRQCRIDGPVTVRDCSGLWRTKRMFLSLRADMIASADKDCRGEGSDQQHYRLRHGWILWDRLARGLKLKVSRRYASFRHCDRLAFGRIRRVNGDGQVVRPWCHPHHVRTVSSRRSGGGLSRIAFSDHLRPRKWAEVPVHVIPVHGTPDHGHRCM
jgi:hypothetical protein